MVGALTAEEGGPKVPPTGPNTLRRLLPHLPVVVLIVAYAVRFSVLSVDAYRGYSVSGFDFSIPDQSLWLLSHFHVPYNTVMGRDFFADHTSFIFVLLVPLYWVWDSQTALLVAQSVIIAVAAVPIYLYARKRLNSTPMATVLTATFLLNPALQNGNMETVHVECFEVLFVALAIYAALDSRVRLLILATAGLLLCKEDAAVIVIPLAAWVAWRRNRYWGFQMFGWAVVGAVLANTFIFALLGQLTAHGGRLPFGGLTGTIKALFTKPVKLFDYMTSSGRGFYVWQLFLSAGLVFVIGPEVAAIGIGLLAVNLLATFPYQHSIDYHYSMPLVPILCLGTVFAIGKLRDVRARRMACSLALTCGLVACYAWGLAPLSRNQFHYLNPSGSFVADLNQLESEVPPDAVVCAFYPFVPHLDHRMRIYEWPTPFAAAYWDTYKQEGHRLSFANQVQYVMLPTDLTGSDESVWQENRSAYRVVTELQGVALYERLPS